MNKKILTILLHCCVFLIPLKAYTHNKSDSIYHLYKNSTIDTNLIKNIIAFADEISFTKPAFALKLTDVSYYLSEKLSFKNGIGKTYLIKGKIYYFIGENTKSAIYSEKAYNIFKTINNFSNLALCYTLKGFIYSRQNNYAKALECFHNSVKIAEMLTDNDGLAIAYNNIGILYKNIDSLDLALYYYNKTLQIDNKFDNKSGIAYTYINIANVLNRKGDYNEALKYYKNALDITISLNDKYSTANIYLNIGNNFSRQKKFNNAEYYFNKSLNAFNELGSTTELTKVYLSFANLYLNKGNLLKADVFTKKTLNNAIKSDDITSKKDAYYLLSIINDSARNYKDALNYRILFSELKDSILNIETQSKLLELQTAYDVENKDKQLEIQKLNIEKQKLLINRKNYFLYGIIAFSIIVLFVFAIMFRMYQLRTKKAKIELQQKLLRSQMNPHFMFNSLLAIQSYIYDNDTEEAVGYLSKFAELMRLILDNSRQEYISLSKEIKTLQNYLELQKVRFENTFEYNVIVDEGLSKDFVYVPPMLAQPFIENAIEHGFKEKKEFGFIEIKFSLQKKNLLFEITDNGIGFKHSKSNNKHKSLALEITKERLYILNKKQFNKKIKFNIIDLGISNQSDITGTKVIFVIPLIEIF